MSNTEYRARALKNSSHTGLGGALSSTTATTAPSSSSRPKPPSRIGRIQRETNEPAVRLTGLPIGPAVPIPQPRGSWVLPVGTVYGHAKLAEVDAFGNGGPDACANASAMIPADDPPALLRSDASLPTLR